MKAPRWLRSLLGEVRGTPGAIDLEGADALVLRADPTQPLPRLLNAGTVVVIQDAHLPVPAGVEVASWRALRRGLDGRRFARCVVTTLSTARVRDVAAAARRGVQRFHLIYGPELALSVGPRGALALVGSRRASRRAQVVPGVERLGSRLGVTLAPAWSTRGSTARALEAVLDAVATRPLARVPATGPLRIVHLIPSLPSGGAERQLTYLAPAQVAAGHDVRVLTLYPLEGAEAHYAPGLIAAGVKVERARPRPRWRPLPELEDATGRAYRRGVVEALAVHAAAEDVFGVVEALREARPHVLHCWQDEANATGGAAGLVAGVPRTVLSTWNVNPSNFPRYHKAWFEDSYRLLAQSRRVTFTANSRAGGDDYARWSGVDPARYVVVPNGFPVDDWPPLAPAERAAGRRRLGLDPEAFVVAGIFRLAPEKRPLDFLQVIARAHAQEPALRALHLGTGGLEPEVRAEATRLGLDGVLTFVGRTEEPRAFLGLGDVSLLTSEVEGSPNVSQESQALELPMLLTRVVGSPETILEGETGRCFEVGDVDAMTAAVLELARDRERCRAMGRRGRELVREQFAIEVMVRLNEALYRG